MIPRGCTRIPCGPDKEKFGIPLSREEARDKLGLPAGRFFVGAVGRLEEQWEEFPRSSGMGKTAVSFLRGMPGRSPKP